MNFPDNAEGIPQLLFHSYRQCVAAGELTDFARRKGEKRHTKFSLDKSERGQFEKQGGRNSTGHIPGSFILPGPPDHIPGSFILLGPPDHIPGSFILPGPPDHIPGSFILPGPPDHIPGLFILPGPPDHIPGLFILPGPPALVS
ncbi:hypothetical protein STEG23_034836 [Scotinomys teguina]